jgi:hypothetical protein
VQYVIAASHLENGSIFSGRELLDLGSNQYRDRQL